MAQQTSKATGVVMQALAIPFVVYGLFHALNAALAFGTGDRDELVLSGIITVLVLLPGAWLLIGGRRISERASQGVAR